MWDIVYFIAMVFAFAVAGWILYESGYRAGMHEAKAIVTDWWPNDRCVHGNTGARYEGNTLVNDKCDCCQDR